MDTKHCMKYCVACASNEQSCTNTTSTPGITMHQFPSDPTAREKWIKFVQKHCHDFRAQDDYASLCSAHFNESCYSDQPAAQPEGIKMHIILKEGSIPTIDAVTRKPQSNQEVMPEVSEKRQKITTNNAYVETSHEASSSLDTPLILETELPSTSYTIPDQTSKDPLTIQPSESLNVKETQSMEKRDALAFGLIQPTLIQQIKKILDEYPDDGQILKELIQNAEDAGAKEVKFLIDHHSYPTASLPSPELAKFQGPALYAYNNAKFTANDWRGVGMLCDSIKVNDPTKVGRFGLGFKSVFHMTDLPSVISGDSLGIIEPHEKYFSDDYFRRSGKRWKLNNPETCQDQFTPYKRIFDCTEDAFQKGIYEGTLFRFPFRQQPSKLSDTIYEESKIQGLIESFKSDAHLILLFLMNLERIEIYERKADRQEAEKMFSVSISEDCKASVQAARQRFNLQMNDKITGDIKETYTVNIETFDCKSNTRNNYSFAITHFLSRGNLSAEMEELKESLSYMPRVGVAFPLNTSTSGNKDDPRDPKGHVFCFLPLPLETKSLTGLPVHVNGFFALSQNRRYLKWRSTGQNKTTDKSLLWNEGLLRDVLPKAYAELILYLIAERKSPEIVYAAWPDLNKIDVKWKLTAENVFRLLLCDSQVFYTDANSGSWCKLNDVTFDSLTENSETRKTVIELLNNLGQKIVTVPSNCLV